MEFRNGPGRAASERYRMSGGGRTRARGIYRALSLSLSSSALFPQPISCANARVEKAWKYDKSAILRSSCGARSRACTCCTYRRALAADPEYTYGVSSCPRGAQLCMRSCFLYLPLSTIFIIIIIFIMYIRACPGASAHARCTSTPARAGILK